MTARRGALVLKPYVVTRKKDGGTFTRTPWANPLVCVCDEPQADPAVDFGTCAVCGRCPLALFRILAVAS